MAHEVNTLNPIAKDLSKIQFKTKLAKTLAQIRDKYIQSGGTLLSLDEVRREVSERRGNQN